MTDKQKVTLYISDDLHRQFKIRSAVDGETMSAMAQRALEFYLSHADVVARANDAHGQAHRVHNCPRCSASMTLKDGGLSLLGEGGSHAFLPQEVSDLTELEKVSGLASEGDRSGEGELVTC